MIVVTVHRQAIAADEVFAVAVIVLILRTHIIMPDGFLEGILVQHNVTVRIGTIAGITGDIRTKNREH